MKKLGPTLAVIASVPLLILGIIFLIGASEESGRIFTAAVFLLLGGVLLVWGAMRLRRLAEIDPETLATGIVDLARRLDGEVTVSQVQAEFRIPRDMALNALEKLRGRGDSQRELRGDHYTYIFRGVMPAKAIKRCPYCGTEFSVKSPLRQCTNCGAALEIVKE